MLSSLSDLCLLYIRDCIIVGKMPINLNVASLVIRQNVFKTIAALQQLDNPNCLDYMKCLLFVSEDFSTIDTRPTETLSLLNYKGEELNHRFILYLTSQFLRKPSLADSITTLRLLCGAKNATIKALRDSFKRIAPDGRRERIGSDSEELNITLRLVRQCKSLKNLSLIFSSRVDLPRSSEPFLNSLANAVRQSESSGLEELELLNVTCKGDFFPTDDQKLAFQRLQLIRLIHVELDNTAWANVLQCCQHTLLSLDLEECYVTDISVIPVLLYQLRFLGLRLKYQRIDLTEVLRFCPMIDSCHVELLERNINVSNVSVIQSLLSKGKVTIEACDMKADVKLLYQLLDIAGSAFTSLTLSSWHFDLQLANRIIEVCSNLRVLKLGISLRKDIVDQFLINLFSDRERARMLSELELHCVMTEQSLDLLFSNCCNLKALNLDNSTYPIVPRDRHLLSWVSGGARPSILHFQKTRFTDVGLKALISACGPSLQQLIVRLWKERCMDSVVDAIVENCPMLQHICLPRVSEQLLKEYPGVRTKFFFPVVAEPCLSSYYK